MEGNKESVWERRVRRSAEAGPTGPYALRTNERTAAAATHYSRICFALNISPGETPDSPNFCMKRNKLIFKKTTFYTSIRKSAEKTFFQKKIGQIVCQPLFPLYYFSCRFSSSANAISSSLLWSFFPQFPTFVTATRKKEPQPISPAYF